MNGRVLHEKTPAKRIAAAFRSYLLTFFKPHLPQPDYADIETKIDPYLSVELLDARIDEVNRCKSYAGQGTAMYMHADRRVEDLKRARFVLLEKIKAENVFGDIT